MIRLKQCEVALADGRLDEAFDLVRPPQVRAHRRGQELIGKIGSALLERARSHLDSGSLQAAAQDCDRAAQLGGNLTEIVQLRREVSTALANQRRAAQVRDQVAASARRHADMGRFTIGEQLIAEAPELGSLADPLRRELAGRRAAVESTVRKADETFRAGDWESAIEHLCRLDLAGRTDVAARELAGKIDAKIVQDATDALETGRLDTAGSLLARLGRLSPASVGSEDLRRTLQQCRQALDALGRGDVAAAELILRALAPGRPGAKWINEAARQAAEARSAIERLKTGPLGSVAGAAPAAISPTAAPAIRPATSSSMIDVILHVDGVGGFRLTDRPAVRIGPVGASPAPDVALAADATLPSIVITRSDEDYFFQSPQPVTVNDLTSNGRLLAHGDRIAPGARCRFVFRQPSAASATAILDFAGARLPSGDVRHLILMDRELIVGPGPSAHIRIDDLPEAAVIQRRDGRLFCRVDGVRTELAPGRHLKIGPTGLVVATRE